MDLWTIKTNFENGIYKLRNAPRVLNINHLGVHVHKDGLHQDELKSLECLDWAEKKVLTPKLKAFSYGDYYLDIGLIGKKYFESREVLDSLYENECWSDAEPGDSQPSIKKEKISLEEALKLLTVTISCNMDYYLANRGEMEADLGKKLDNLDLKNKQVLTQLEKELLYSQMTKIFGEDNEHSEEIILTNFHILYSDGNHVHATAKRGDYYWILFYRTS